MVLVGSLAVRAVEATLTAESGTVAHVVLALQLDRTLYALLQAQEGSSDKVHCLCEWEPHLPLCSDDDRA